MGMADISASKLIVTSRGPTLRGRDMEKVK
jgi:hypothetical protein